MSKLFAVLFLVFAVSPVAWSQAKDDLPASDRLLISRTQGHDGGTLTSEKRRDDGTLVLHGLQVKYGPRLQIREYSVYNEGQLEQLYQLFPNGNSFRVMHRRANGDGDEVVYTAAATKTVADKVAVDGGQDIGPIKTQDVLTQGTIKADRRHSGTFLVRELQGFQFKWMKQEFKDGQAVKSEPFPIDKLDLTEIPGADADEHWPWTVPQWPTTRTSDRGR